MCLSCLVYSYLFKEAIKDSEWCKAINDELRAIELNGTWEMTTLPHDKKAIDCHWIFKTKLKADGSMDKKKARLVVNGNRQRNGIDYEETFALVAKNGIFISQKKYTTDLLKENGVLNEKLYKLPMDQHVKHQADIGTPLPDLEVYRRLIGKLIYLTITRPNICYTVQLLSQFMQNPTSVHMQAVKHLLRYLLSAHGQDVFTKALTTEQHHKPLSKLGVSAASHSQLEGECKRGE
ncbi:cysteine-rich receptor-like protein kinase 8 [Tanacetum coccineum]